MIPYLDVLKDGMNAIRFLAFRAGFLMRSLAALRDFICTETFEKPIFFISTMSCFVDALRIRPTVRGCNDMLELTSGCTRTSKGP